MNEDRTRTLLVVGAAVLALLAIGSGAMIALSGDGEEVSDTLSPTTEPRSTSTPTGTAAPTAGRDAPTECQRLRDRRRCDVTVAVSGVVPTFWLAMSATVGGSRSVLRSASTALRYRLRNRFMAVR